MIVRDPDGVAVLTLGNGAPVNGYVVTGYDEGSRSFRRVTAYAPFVDGEEDVATSLNRATLTLELFITGESWADIRAKHRAILAAVEVKGWILDVDGSVLWRCEVADSTSPTPGLGLGASGRYVTLTIPAQPVYGI